MGNTVRVQVPLPAPSKEHAGIIGWFRLFLYLMHHKNRRNKKSIENGLTNFLRVDGAFEQIDRDIECPFLGKPYRLLAVGNTN